VAPELRVRRRDELVSLQQRVSEGFAQSLVGRTVEVLVDAVDEDGGFIGRTQWDAPDGGGPRRITHAVPMCCPSRPPWHTTTPACSSFPTLSASWSPKFLPPPQTAVDPVVFLAEEDPSLPRLEVGQMRLARVDGASIFDLEATVVA
jgi:hypothetical protein